MSNKREGKKRWQRVSICVLVCLTVGGAMGTNGTAASTWQPDESSARKDNLPLLHLQVASPIQSAQRVSVPLQADHVLLSVPRMSQRPELVNGCEVTSLAMLLQSAGHAVDKRELARRVEKDRTPERRDSQGRTIYWGDPKRGFVGDVTGVQRGYGVYHQPIAHLLGQYLPGRALDLSGSSFQVVLDAVANGRPVVVWTTAVFAPVGHWVEWRSPSGAVRATWLEHAVLVIGYTTNTVTINDPLDGTQKTINRPSFIAAWEQMGRQAVTYRSLK